MMKQDNLLQVSSSHSFQISLEGVRNGTDGLVDLLKAGQLRLVAHSHPDYGVIVLSADDRKCLVKCQRVFILCKLQCEYGEWKY